MIGIIANVRVSFTVTALSKVSLPRLNIASQVAAAAVTEDVSFTAVPAKIPKASPFVWQKPISFPKFGKTIAARTLKKKITEIACDLASASNASTNHFVGGGIIMQIEKGFEFIDESFPRELGFIVVACHIDIKY